MAWRPAGDLRHATIVGAGGKRVIVVARVVGFLIGGALIVFGFFLWMLSNDGIGGEVSMKLTGAAGMIIGLTLCGSALLWKRHRNKDDLEF